MQGHSRNARRQVDTCKVSLGVDSGQTHCHVAIIPLPQASHIARDGERRPIPLVEGTAMTCGLWKKGGVKNGDHECNLPHLDGSCELTGATKNRSDPEFAQEATGMEAVLS